MENLELNREIEEKIALCRQKYEENREDPYLSNSLSSELDSLQYLYDRIREESLTEELLSEIKIRFAELEEEKEKEEYFPSFSWYGEHYNYIVLDGRCDAYRAVIEIMTRYCTDQNESGTTDKEDQGRKE